MRNYITNEKIIIFLILAIIVIAFGGGKPESSQRIIITTASWTATPTEMQLSKELVGEFEKLHPTIKVKYDVITGDYRSKIVTQLAGGSAPESFWADMGFIRSLISRGAISELTPYIQADGIDTSDFYPSLLEPYIVNGKIYGLPDNATPLALFYNKELFDKAGISYPDDSWTWDNLLQAGKKLTLDADKDGVIEQWGIMLPRRPDFWFPFIYQNGGEVFDEKDPTILYLAEPAALEAMRFYVDLSLKYHISPGHGQASDLDITKGFQLGKTAMMISGWYDMVDTDKHAPLIKYGVAPLPKRKQPSTTIFATATVMSKDARHPKETWEFIKFMTGKEGQLIRCKSGMAGPSRKSVAQDSFFRDKSKEQVFISGLNYGKGFYGTYTDLIVDEFGRAYERALLGQQSVEKSFQEAYQNYLKRKKQQ